MLLPQVVSTAGLPRAGGGGAAQAHSVDRDGAADPPSPRVMFYPADQSLEGVAFSRQKELAALE